VPPKIKLANVLDVMTKPAWAMGVLRGKRKTFGNLDGWLPDMKGVKSLSQWISGQFDASLNWKDVEWIRSIWPGKLILKGILDVEDARIAAGAGAEAIVVSNHGGRQLDGAPSSISVLPGIADAVRDRTEVLFDGGVRSGQDVLRAIALGARACLIGKAFLYGLGAGGEEGVRKVIEIIRKEMEVTMVLTGRRNLAEVDRTILMGH
jgi:L-lactate dehydrogenase (cytochrome)